MLGGLSQKYFINGQQTSSNRPIFIDHRKMSKTSWPPAAINSAVESMATHPNWTGLGDVKVRKLRYLKQSQISCNSKPFYPILTNLVMSKALTVPSSDDEMTTFLLLLNCTPVTVEECSWNVTKQNPDVVFQILTF